MLGHIAYCLKSCEVVIVKWENPCQKTLKWMMCVPDRVLLFYFVVMFDTVKGVPGQALPSVLLFG